MGAKEMQAKPNESKKKKLAFPLISVAESSFFNALRQIQIKKTGFSRHSRLRLCKAAERAFLSDTAFRGPQP
jgi:hypothetical protein